MGILFHFECNITTQMGEEIELDMISKITSRLPHPAVTPYNVEERMVLPKFTCLAVVNNPFRKKRISDE